jgi:hypothetical protein
MRVTTVNGPKVHREPLLSVMAGCASGYMLEHLSIRWYSNFEDPMSENPTGADNQQERLSADSESSEAIRRISGFITG